MLQTISRTVSEATVSAILRRAAVDEDVRCVVLCGNDAFFSAGADVAAVRYEARVECRRDAATPPYDEATPAHGHADYAPAS